MNWINAFEIICYIITSILIIDIIKNKNFMELSLLISGAVAGFMLELLAVRFTGIYHYSDLYYISIGFKPYQFPFFGGIMWGGVAVCSLRISKKFKLNKVMTAILAGWFVVSMDLLLDVAAIRLDGGFWVWENLPIILDINQHMFMSVIWVNFLGYMFETPAIIYMTLKNYEKIDKNINILKSLSIGIGGVVFVAIASGISIFLNRITDDWFSFTAFIFIWCFLFINLIKSIVNQRKNISLKGKKDKVLIIFWTSIYLYCIFALWKLEIIRTLPIYGIFSIFIAAMTILLCMISIDF